MKKIYLVLAVALFLTGAYCLQKVSVPPVLQGIRFHSALPVVLGQGGHFYRVQLGSPFMTAQKVSFHPRRGKTSLHIKGLKIQLIDLLALSPDLHQVLHHYVPYRDILTYPLESLALAGFDTLRGDLHCAEKVLVPPYTQIDCRFDGDEPVQIRLSCTHGLQTSWNQMTCPDITVILPWGLIERYRAYANGRQYPCPVERQENITLHVTMTAPLKDIFRTPVKTQVLKGL